MARHLIASDALIRRIKPGDTRTRLNDGDGLHLLLFVKGGSHGWRFAYSFEGRRNVLSLGTYPDTSIALARKRADEARSMLREGTDPSVARKADKAEAVDKRQAAKREAAGLPALDAFETLAREWFETHREGWAEAYGEKILARLEADVFPYLGRRGVDGITPPELLAVLRRIEERGAIETAHRVRGACSQIFRFAVATGRAGSDPARDLVKGLRKPTGTHFAAITEPQQLGVLLNAIDGYAGTFVVRTALKLAPMLMLRPGELRFARWSEIDLAAALWTVPAARMKRTRDGKLHGAPHLVPLPRQAMATLEDLRPLTGDGEYVFRGERDRLRPMSENTVNVALRTMGFPRDEVTGHGFRATARTMLHERLGIEPDVIEAQLAHNVRDSLGRAYNRTQFVEQRRTMLQAWADYLDQLRSGESGAKNAAAAK